MNSEDPEIHISQKSDPTNFNPTSGGHIEQKDGHTHIINYDQTPRCSRCERLLKGKGEMAMGICNSCQTDDWE